MATQSNAPFNEDDIRDVLPAYAVGAADPEEAARVQAYLKQHPEAAREVAEYAAAAGLLMGGVTRRDPPPALRQKLLEAARAQRPAQNQARPISSNRQKFVIPTWWAWGATAAAMILLVMNVLMMGQMAELRARQAALEQTNQDQLAALQRASQATLNEALTIWVTGTKAELMDDSGEMRAMVMWQPGESEAVMFTHSLPPLDESRIYQLWLIDEAGTPVSAGTFSVDASGRATLMFDAQTAIDALNGLGISVEPMGGSALPTTPPLAITEL